MQARHRLTRNRVNRALLRRLLPKPSNRSDLVRLGVGWCAWCTPTSLLRPGAVCYCVGVGADITFDLALVRDYGCEVWAFDPTPQTQEWVATQDTPDGWHFEPVGLWTEDTTIRFRSEGGSHSITRAGKHNAFDGKVETLTTIMRRLGHDRIDLLKMDIEGAEGPVLRQLIASDVRPSALLVEFDQPEPAWRTARLIREVLDAGYRLDRLDHWNGTFTR